jgi:cyanophycinase-like exopeptidase
MFTSANITSTQVTLIPFSIKSIIDTHFIKEITMNRIVSTTAAIAMLILLTGCDASNTEQAAQVDTPAATQEVAHSWMLASAPEGAVSILEAKASLKEGDQVVIRGRIGGRLSPINSGSPVFTIVDLGLEYCGQHNDDNCSSPWDYCCETPETITGNSATVQVMGDGMIDPVAAGLEPLDEVVLIGTVGPRPDDQVFVIRATGVYSTDG